MNRVRRRLRWAIAALFFAFLALLTASYRRPGAKATTRRDDVAETLVRELNGVSDQIRFRDFDWTQTREEEGSYRLRASEAVGFTQPGGEPLFRLKDARFESREKGQKSTVAIVASRAEFNQASKALRVFGDFRIEGAQGTTLMGSSFRYDPPNRKFLSEGPVTALRDRLVAKADAGTVETRGGSVRLEGSVRLSGVERERPLDLRAASVTFSGDGSLDARGAVVLKTEGGVLRSEIFDREPEGSGDILRAREKAVLVLAQREPPAEPRPGQLTLTSPLNASGDVIELSRDAEGRPTRLSVVATSGTARLDLAPSGKAGARRAVSARFDAAFVDGRLREVTVPTALDAAETPPADAPPTAVLRTLAAGFARFVFREDGSTLDVASFDHGLTVADGTRTLKAARGTLRESDQEAVFTGEGDTPAEYLEPGRALRASTIAYHRKEERVDASGNVRTQSRGSGRAVFPGAEDGEPLFSESDSLRLQLRERKVLLTGNVRAWQRENILRCRSLALDDTARTLRAEGRVQAFLRRRVERGKGPPTVETVNASGDVLTHREADRLVRIEGSSSLVSGGWVLTSDVTDIRLTADRTIEYGEARGKVVLEDRVLHRRGEGTKATWRPQLDLVTLNGDPATAVDERGNRLTGAGLTFRQGRSQVDVDSSGAVPSEAVVKPEKRL